MADFIDDRAHALYRFFDGRGRLLYIGITWNIAARFPQHMDDKPWWDEIKNITLEQYPNRRAVLEAEKWAIQKEHPRYNVVHRLIPPPAPKPTDPYPVLARIAPELTLAATWAERQGKLWPLLGDHEHVCALELWYGYPAARRLLGDMGIRDLVTSLAGWDAGERVWPEESNDDISGVKLATFLNQQKPLGPKSPTWMPPRDIHYNAAEARFVYRVIARGWQAPEILRNTHAYDTVYEHFLTLLPDCRNCSCVGSAA